MKPSCLLCLLGGCLLSHWAPSSSLNCEPQQYRHNGECCSLCGPGQKLLADCPALGSQHCGPCEEGHFQSGWTKEKHCIPHKYCDANAGLVKRIAGNDTHNAECGCQEGMYCSSPDCQTCLKIKACSPGSGVIQKATNFSDTVCMACEHGNFSNTFSVSEPCHPWTRCEMLGLVVKMTGTSSSDVECETSRHRSSLLLLIPVMAAAAVCLLVFILYRLRPRGLMRCRQKQGTMLPEAVDIMPLPEKQPAEVDYEEHDERQDFPVQETLLGCQPVAQEDGKESRISEQEKL